MTNRAQEHVLPQVEHAIRYVLCEAAEQLARPTGLIKRQGKVTGPTFAQTLVLGWLADPQASLETLAQHAAEVGWDITAQGLDERFTPAAATFLQALFEVALGQVVLADPVAILLLARFADPRQRPTALYDSDWLSDVRKIGAENYYPRLDM